MVSIDLLAVEEELVVRVLIDVVDHEADPELLPLLVHLEVLHRTRHLVTVQLHLVEVISRVRVVTGHFRVRHDLEISTAVDTTLPADNMVVLVDDGVLVMEEELRCHQRHGADPDVSLRPLERVRVGSVPAPLVELGD